MPDNDRFPRSLGRRWRKPFRLAMAVDAPEHVATEMTAAMAGLLRDTGGCPGTKQLAVQLRDIALYGEGDGQQILAEFRAQAGRSLLAEKICDEAEVFLETRASLAQVMTDDDVRHSVVEGGLSRLADAEMFSRGHDQLFDKHGSLRAVTDYKDGCLERMQLGGLADSLVAHPDGDGVRAPARKNVPETTDLLNEDFS